MLGGLRAGRGRAAALLIASLAGLADCGAQRGKIGAGYAGTPVVPAKPAPNAELTDQRGRRAHIFEGNASATFLFFGYTHCPDECPLALASLGSAFRRLPAATATRIRIVFVTVDPARDTPAVIERYLRKFDPHIVGFTGPAVELSRVWRAYGVTVDPTSHDIGHGDEIYAIDRTRDIVLIYPPDASPSDLSNDAIKLATS